MRNCLGLHLYPWRAKVSGERNLPDSGIAFCDLKGDHRGRHLDDR